MIKIKRILVVRTWFLMVLLPMALIPQFSIGADRSATNFTYEKFLKMSESDQYSMVFQLRRAMRLGMKWGHLRAREKAIFLHKDFETPDGGCLLHPSTGSVMGYMKRYADARPELIKEDVFYLFGLAVITVCKEDGEDMELLKRLFVSVDSYG